MSGRKTRTFLTTQWLTEICGHIDMKERAKAAHSVAGARMCHSHHVQKTLLSHMLLSLLTPQQTCHIYQCWDKTNFLSKKNIPLMPMRLTNSHLLCLIVCMSHRERSNFPFVRNEWDSCPHFHQLHENHWPACTAFLCSPPLQEGSKGWLYMQAHDINEHLHQTRGLQIYSAVGMYTSTLDWWSVSSWHECSGWRDVYGRIQSHYNSPTTEAKDWYLDHSLTQVIYSLPWMMMKYSFVR